MTAERHCANPDCGHRRRTGAPAALAPAAASCPHCGAPVAAASDEAYVPLALLATFPEPYLGHLVRARLEAEGIFAVIADEHLAALGHLAGDGGVRLHVRQDQLAAARAIVEMPSMDVDASDAFEDDDAATVADAPGASHGRACPRCRSHAVTARQRTGIVARIFGERWQCGGCGHAWR